MPAAQPKAERLPAGLGPKAFQEIFHGALGMFFGAGGRHQMFAAIFLIPQKPGHPIPGDRINGNSQRAQSTFKPHAQYPQKAFQNHSFDTKGTKVHNPLIPQKTRPHRWNRPCPVHAVYALPWERPSSWLW